MQNSEIVHLTLNSLSLFLLLQESHTPPDAADLVPALPEPEQAKRGTFPMYEGVSAFNCIIIQINEQ